MKDTPIQKAIAEIEKEIKRWEYESPSPVIGALLCSRQILQSLLPYERECIIKAYCADMEVDLTNDAHDYFTNTYNNPQGGGGE